MPCESFQPVKAAFDSVNGALSQILANQMGKGGGGGGGGDGGGDGGCSKGGSEGGGGGSECGGKTCPTGDRPARPRKSEQQQIDEGLTQPIYPKR